MKKLTLILMAAMLMMTAGSCKKDKTDVNGNGNGTTTTNDGVFNPSQKISKYYYWDDYDEEKELREIWNWEGKQLSSIDYTYEDGYVYGTEYFTYDQNRLSKVEHGETYVDFKYADGKLKKVSVYYDYELEREYTLSYGSNNKISVINMVYYDGKKSEKGMLNPLGLFLPEQIAGRLESNRERRRSERNIKDDGVETASVKLTWDGDNVSRAVAEGEYSEGGYSESYSEDYTYYYDNKHNPKYGFVNRSFPGMNCFSANNFTKFVCTWREMEYENGILEEDESGTYEGRFTYQYDNGGYPTMVEETEYYPNSGNTYVDRYYYEYK